MPHIHVHRTLQQILPGLDPHGFKQALFSAKLFKSKLSGVFVLIVYSVYVSWSFKKSLKQWKTPAFHPIRIVSLNLNASQVTKKTHTPTVQSYPYLNPKGFPVLVPAVHASEHVDPVEWYNAIVHQLKQPAPAQRNPPHLLIDQTQTLWIGFICQPWL